MLTALLQRWLLILLVFHADIGGCARLFTEEEVEGAQSQDGFFVPGRLPVIVAAR